MKKMTPLALALLSIAVFLGLIFKNEWHLNNSQTMYVRLQPVDPRSIIQGDYMALNYQLYFAPQHLSPESTSQANINQEDQIFSGHYFDEVIKNKSVGLYEHFSATQNSYVSRASVNRVQHK